MNNFLFEKSDFLILDLTFCDSIKLKQINLH